MQYMHSQYHVRSLKRKMALWYVIRKNLHTLNAFTDISIYVTRKICHKGLNLVSI